MSKKDLFDESTMTFGEHLEVLRVHLIKALIGLVIGVLASLAFSQHIIRWIQKPVKAAMHRHFLEPIDDLGNNESPPLQLRKTDENSATATGTSKAAAPPAEQATPAHPVALPSNGAEKPVDLVPPELANGFQISVDGIDLIRQLHKISPESIPAPPADAKPSSVTLTLAKNDLNRLMNVVNASQLNPRTDRVDEAFMTYMKVSLGVGFILSSPWVLYQIWLFVAAGLYPHERKYVHRYLPLSVGLFLGGAIFCYFAVIPFVLDFLFSFNTWLGLRPELKIGGWISFALMLSLMFGVSFQLPLVMLFLERISIFSSDDYRTKRRMAIFVISVVSMILTPSDPISMSLMMVPLCILYEVGIMLCGQAARSPFEAQTA